MFVFIENNLVCVLDQLVYIHKYCW